MSPVRPRGLVRRGRHVAAGVLLEASLHPAERLRRRALALWEPGARVLAVDGGLVVRFARPRALDAQAAPGHLLVEEEGRLLAAPLSPAERAALAAPEGAVVVARGGVAVALAVGPELDPSAWLGLEPPLVTVEPLGRAPDPPAPPPPPVPADVRGVLKVAPAAPAASEAAAAIRAALTGRGTSGAASGSGGARAVGAAFGWAAGRLRDALRALAARGADAPARPGARASAAPPPPPGPLRLRVRAAWTRLLLVTRVARLAGLRQGAYLGRLVRMFERGDLDEALRHAIPLGGEGAGGPLALGLPRARTALEVSPGRGPTSSMPFGQSLYAEMQQLYRRALAQLEAQGRIDEAAFVLAELLHADLEAVSFLERHGRLRLAAEMAEARRLAPGLVVRQWFLAGDLERAVRIARAERAFADAVDRLERTDRRDDAAALRLCWAEDLAEGGDLEGAVRTAWPLGGAARGLLSRWIELAVGSGSEAGHALLARWLTLEPGRFPEVRERFERSCAEGGEDGPHRRAALARGLLHAEATAAVRPLARLVVRGLLRDRAAGHGVPPFAPLLQLAADRALETDVPAAQRRLSGRAGPLEVKLRPDDRGARPALDAAVLPDGRVLVALGEGGAALLARDGRAVVRFDVPADRLVISHLGTRALALGARGEATRVARLDLGARAARTLRDLRLVGSAPAFDGVRWVVAQPGAVAVLDTLRDDLRALWHVTDLPGPPVALDVDDRATAFVTAGLEGAEGWHYVEQVLRRRAQLSSVPPGRALLAVSSSADGRWHAVVQDEGAGAFVEPATGGVGARHALGAIDGVLAFAGGHVLTVAVRTAAGAEVVVLEPSSLALVAKVSLPGADQVAVRNAGRRVTLADALGRVVGLDADAGRVTHDVRT